ncbi:MAG TPA: cytochrome P450 [Solirubrobacteraceae bacterium]|nr:cytochrome P450 [Solirubrobacteraceae bacterium]
MSAQASPRARAAPSAATEPAESLPPGPPLPRALQTIALMALGARFLDACRRRYGDLVTIRTVFDEAIVMVFDPQLLRVVFQAPADRLRAGEANALLAPVLGDRSVLVLDGEEHLARRRLMLPAFHGERLRAHEQTMRDCADEEIDRWPVGVPFSLLERMQALTLRVILRVVFGTERGDLEDELARRLRAMVAPLSRPGGVIALIATLRGARRRGAARQFAERRQAVDELLYAEIARRRSRAPAAGAALAQPAGLVPAQPAGLVPAQPADVFSELLAATGEDGSALEDREVRDQLVTLLLAGHETTATALAWTLDLLLHDRRALALARERDGAHLDAVVREALRIRPPIPGVGRVVRGAPFELGGFTLPVGTEIDASIRVIHGRGDLYPDPSCFRPERFLGDDPPDTYTWVPFGGGVRRCLGAAFAQAEMRVVLERVLERTQLRALSRRPARPQFRGIVIAPGGGVRAILDSPPRAAGPSHAPDQ